MKALEGEPDDRDGERKGEQDQKSNPGFDDQPARVGVDWSG